METKKIVKFNFDNFTFRSSGLGNIMTGVKTNNLTDNQELELEKLKEKNLAGTTTPKQSIKLNELIAKRDKGPELSEGVKSYLKTIHKAKVYGRSKQISSKYLEKGIYVEEFSLSLLSNYDDKFYIKNDKRFYNEFIEGEPDNNQDIIRDIKSSWDYSTFPLHDEEIKNKLYEWQLRGYMALCDLEEAELIYCLVDTPEHIIQSDLRSFCFKSGINPEEIPEEAEKEIRNNLTYSDIPIEYRIKKFRITRDIEKEKLLYDRVKLCREYLNKLNDFIK